jgi:Sulfotransferase family
MSMENHPAGGPIWEHIRRPWWVRLINAAGAGLRRVGICWPRLDAGALLAAARRRSGLSDFGDGRFREGLGVLVDAFNARDDAHAFGRIVFSNHVVSLLVNRLKIQADLTRHPEILDVPLARPLFITGLPRSGTTFLHRLMSEDPAGRTLRTWEGWMPSPPPTYETYETDPRIAFARRQADLVSRLSPRLATAHEVAAESPEEDNYLFARDFQSVMFAHLFEVPDYTRWLKGRDLRPSYHYARRQLQLLSWKYRADHWVLKAPAHLPWLGDLLETFPDASVIVTHRDPLQVIPSLCSLMAGLRGIVTERLDLRRLGAETAEELAWRCERMIAVRAGLDPARFLDVSYERLVADPISTIREACRHFGYDFTPEYEARARRYIAENPRHKHGAHRYCLEDFGLDEATVNHHFADYRDWLAGRGLVAGC